MQQRVLNQKRHQKRYRFLCSIHMQCSMHEEYRYDKFFVVKKCSHENEIRQSL